MKNNKLLLIAWLPVALLAAGLPGCELAVLGAAGSAAYSIGEDRRTSGTQLDDERIEARAKSRVDDRFGAKVHLTVTSFNRMALLTGEAPDEATREEISKIVAAVPAVRGVTNEIQVGEPSNRASRIGDEFITTKIKGQMINSPVVSPVYAKVITEASVVYLMGLVTEKEAAEAVEIARTTGGVRKVVKIFEYCKDSDELCQPRAKQPPPPPRLKSDR